MKSNTVLGLTLVIIVCAFSISVRTAPPTQTLMHYKARPDLSKAYVSSQDGIKYVHTYNRELFASTLIFKAVVNNLIINGT